MREGRYRIALLAVWAGVQLMLFRPELHGMDTVAYYAWLRSAVLQGNLDAGDEFERFGFGERRGLSPTGHRINEWPVGPALLWSPFFLAAHLLVRLGNALGIPWAADGFSPPYLVLTALGSALYALIGWELLRQLAGRFAAPGPAFWGVVTAGLASPLVFYMSAHPFMAHAADFFVHALFLWTWWRPAAAPLGSRLALGVLGGLAASIRYQNAPLLLGPALEDLVAAVRTPRRGLLRGAALGIGAATGFLPQMIAWRIVFGDWVVGNPYGVAGAGAFDGRSPHFLDVWFSTDRGFFVWMPAAALALAGILGPLRARRPRWATWLLAYGLIQGYIVGSWSAWSGAAAFGPRLLIGLVPAVALGLAALYDEGRRRWGMGPAVALSLAAILWNLILLARYGLGDVPRSGPVPLAALWGGQLAFVGRLGAHAGALFQALLRRGP